MANEYKEQHSYYDEDDSYRGAHAYDDDAEQYDDDAEQYDDEDMTEEPESEEESREEDESERAEDSGAEEEPDEETLAKKLQKERRKEIKHILLGNFVVFEDGSYGAGNGAWVTPFGFGDGAQGTILLGVGEKQIRYGSSLRNSTKVMYQVLNHMKKIARRLILVTAPEAAACYVRSLIFRPVVLLFEEANDGENQMEFVLHAYCSRSIFSFLAVRQAVKRFERGLPKQIFRIAKQEPQKTDSENNAT